MIDKSESGLISALTIPVVVIATAIVVAALVAPMYRRHDGPHRRSACSNNLRQIGMSLHVYACDNQGLFPGSLAELEPAYLSDSRILSCPVAREHVTPGAPHYEYVSGLRTSAPPTSVVLYDGQRNHRGGGRNVLFVDGHVEWMFEGRFRERLAKTHAWIARRRTAPPAGD